MGKWAVMPEEGMDVEAHALNNSGDGKTGVESTIISNYLLPKPSTTYGRS